MAKEFSCFRNISAIQQSSNVNTRRGKFESNWIFCSFIICYRIRYIMICWYSKAPSFRGNSKIRLLPPTRDALIQHIYKAAYVSGYVWGTSHIPARMKESPANWAQSFIGTRIKCIVELPLITQNLNKTVFKKCGCRKGCKKNRKCKKLDIMKCLPTCKCRGKCEEK